MDFDILIKNGWLSQAEADKFKTDNGIKECIDLCTSPQKTQIFNALIHVPFEKVKVVIIGKDPYPNPKDAHGFAFSSLDKKTPRSLINVFKVIDQTYGSNLLNGGKNDLTEWVKSGVLLLNTSLTFQKIDDDTLSPKEKESLKKKTQLYHIHTWEPFIDTIIKKILTIKDRPVVMILWSNEAHKRVFSNISDKSFQVNQHSRKPVIVPNTSVMLLQTSHPSPQAVNTGGDFMTTMPEHFRICDEYLGDSKIDWTKL